MTTPKVDELLDLIAALTDPDPCWYDHSGSCQAHGQGSEPYCAHRRAQELLARLRPDTTPDTIDLIPQETPMSDTYTLISAASGDRMPEIAVEISDPASPISWDALPAHAQRWAEKNGYGDDDELLYVAPGEANLDGWPTLTVQL